MFIYPCLRANSSLCRVGVMASATEISFKTGKWLRSPVSCWCPIPLRDALGNSSVVTAWTGLRSHPGGRSLSPCQHGNCGLLGLFPPISSGRSHRCSFSANSEAINRLTLLPHSAGKCNRPREANSTTKT